MDINANAHAAIPVATQKLGRLAHEVASLTTPQETPTAVHYGKEVFDDKSRTSDLDAATRRVYDAKGRIDEPAERSVEDLVVERMAVVQSIEAAREVAKATNNMVGALIDETV